MYIKTLVNHGQQANGKKSSMGVVGLLPNVRGWRSQVSLRDLAKGKPGGITVGVDAHVWLHEMVAKHARAVLIDKNPKVVAFEILERCRHFTAWGVKTILVFDGMRQPLKHRTNEERARRRIKCQIEVERLLVSDDVEIDDSLLRSAVAVNEEMVLMVIDHLRANGWSHYVRAPYEADGQLAFMAWEGEIDYVQTIDSDLLAHGCPRVLMRMSPGGWCDLYDRASLWLLLCSEFSEGDDGNRRTLVRQRPWSSFGSRVA